MGVESNMQVNGGLPASERVRTGGCERRGAEELRNTEKEAGDMCGEGEMRV